MLLKRTGLAVLALAVRPAAAAPRDVAVRYVTEHPGELGVTRADVADLAITTAYRSSHSGVTHVNAPGLGTTTTGNSGGSTNP